MKEYIVHVPKHLETNQEKIVSFFGEPIIELIRCKDCARNPKNGKARTICPCPMDRYMGPEGYCSKAEPKEADEE